MSIAGRDLGAFGFGHRVQARPGLRSCQKYGSWHEDDQRFGEAAAGYVPSDARCERQGVYCAATIVGGGMMMLHQSGTQKPLFAVGQSDDSPDEKTSEQL